MFRWYGQPERKRHVFEVPHTHLDPNGPKVPRLEVTAQPSQSPYGLACQEEVTYQEFHQQPMMRGHRPVSGPSFPTQNSHADQQASVTVTSRGEVDGDVPQRYMQSFLLMQASGETNRSTASSVQAGQSAVCDCDQPQAGDHGGVFQRDSAGVRSQRGRGSPSEHEQMDVDSEMTCSPSKEYLTDKLTNSTHNSYSSNSAGHVGSFENGASIPCSPQGSDQMEPSRDRNKATPNMLSGEVVFSTRSADNGETKGQFITAAATESVAAPAVSEAITSKLSSQQSTCTFASEQHLPVNPTEENINTFNAELAALNAKVNELLIGKNHRAMTKREQQLLKNCKKAKAKLQKELKVERQRQSLQNLELSQKLQQQYGLTASSALSAAEQESDQQSRLNYFKEICTVSSEITEVESQIEELQSEDMEAKVMHCKLKQLTKRKNILQNRQSELERCLRCLSKEKVRKTFGVDPFGVLQRVGKEFATWRQGTQERRRQYLREIREAGILTFEDSSSDDEKEEPSMGPGNRTRQGSGNKELQNEEETEVLVISDDEDTPESEQGYAYLSDKYLRCKSEKQWRQLLKIDRKICKDKNTTEEIDKCVEKYNMREEAEKSHFLVSALVSVLLSKRQNKREGRSGGHSQSEQDTAASGGAVQKSASCQLIAEVADKMKLTPQHQLAAKLKGAQRAFAARQQHQEQLQTRRQNLRQEIQKLLQHQS